MRTAALLAAVGAAFAEDAERCPTPSEVADVYTGLFVPSVPLHLASDSATGEVLGQPWNWVQSDRAALQPFQAEKDTLRCGAYYGWPCRRVANTTEVRVNCKSEVCDIYAFLYHEPPRSSNTNGRLPLSLPGKGWQTGSCAPQFCFDATDIQARSAAALSGIPTASPTRAPASPPPASCCHMTAFRKQIGGGSAESFVVDEIFGTMDAYWLVLAVAPGARCGSNARQQSQADCEERPRWGNAACRWVPAAGEEHGDRRAATVLQAAPTMSPTASPEPGAGRCVDNWCPRNPVPYVPRELPQCDAPLGEPDCGGSTGLSLR